jgi:2OG-Fe(II) oxygenase superfamily
MKRWDITAGAFVIEHVLSVKECTALIERAGRVGFELAPITTANGFEIAIDIRNNDRVIFDDRALADEIWSRVRTVIPANLGGRQAVGLNEHFRLYRYTRGQRFAWHSDGSFRRDNGETSLLTFMIYLNQGYAGGETRFKDADVIGHTGMALVFKHELVHEGSEVSNGEKYALRSDVMYGRVGELHG